MATQALAALIVYATAPDQLTGGYAIEQKTRLFAARCLLKRLWAGVTPQRLPLRPHLSDDTSPDISQLQQNEGACVHTCS